MNKKYLLFGLPLLALLVVSAALVINYGQVEQTINVDQAVVLTCPNDICEESINGFSGDILISNVYTLDNNADSSREVDLVSAQSVEIEVGEINTSYLKMLDYAYSQTWTANGDVLVEVEDTDDGWLQWTYTATDTPTSGTLKMTMEINNPTGFGITTFDDGSHDGWYYYDSEGIVRISDYNGNNKIEGYDWVETMVGADSMGVRINKEMLPDTFMWQGFANFHLASNWIEINQLTIPWTPTGSATIRENLLNQFTMNKESGFDFVIVNEISDLSDGIEDGEITTEALPSG